MASFASSSSTVSAMSKGMASVGLSAALRRRLSPLMPFPFPASRSLVSVARHRCASPLRAGSAVPCRHGSPSLLSSASTSPASVFSHGGLVAPCAAHAVAGGCGSVGGGVRWHGSTADEDLGGPVTVVFVSRDGEEISVVARAGQNLLEVAHKNDIDMEGACEGAVACSTCHVILEDDVFDELEEATEEEEDMLDQAPGLTPTSRLGCQVVLTEDLDGLRVKLPSITRNFYVDGHRPQPH